MQIGMIGLGKMGANMVRRLMRDGHECVVNNRTPAKVDRLASEGASAAYSIDELIKKLHKPRAVWVMVPAGTATENTVMELADKLDPGDMVIDGGNSYYKDTVRLSTVANTNTQCSIAIEPPQPAAPCAIAIFGAAGDLTKRLLLPALYNLAQSGLLSENFAIVGVAHTNLSGDEFRAAMRRDIQEFATQTVESDF